MHANLPPIVPRSRAFFSQAVIVSTLLFQLGLAVAPALAQATLTGTVTNAATGRTLEGAVVEIRGTTREALTDAQGVFRIENVPAGVVTLVTSYTGLKSDTAQIEVAGGGTVNHDVGLTADIYLMSKLIVSGEREGQAQAITLQKMSEGVKNIVSTDAFGNVKGNPADLLVRLPAVEGIYCSDQIRYVRIRGMNENLTTVTMDGNRLADAASAGATRQFQFQTVSSDTIQRLEVVKSPTPDMDGDSIGGAVNMVSKSAFDTSGERRLTALVGVVSRFTDPRPDPKIFPIQLNMSYSEVFAKKLAVAFNYAYRRVYTLSDYNNQSYEQLPNGVGGPAYRYQVALTDYREETSRRGGGVRFDYKLSDAVRVYVNATLNFITEHEYDSYVTWATNQAVATRDASGALTGPNGITPGYTEDFTAVRAVPNSTIALQSTSPYKDGKTQNISAGGVHRYHQLELDYNLYASNSKTNYAHQLIYTITDRGVGFNIQKSDNEWYPTVTQTGGRDWSQISSYQENSYTRQAKAGWDRYRGASLNAKKAFATPVPTYLKAGYRFRQQTRRVEDNPQSLYYVGPDGVMGPNASGINDDNLGQFGIITGLKQGSKAGYYPNVPQPAHPNRENGALDSVLQSNPSYFAQNGVPVNGTVTNQIVANLQNHLQNNQEFKEDIDAVYLMGEVELGKLSILGGARVERTKVGAEGALNYISPAEAARRAAFTGPVTDAENIRRTIAQFGNRQTAHGENRFVLPGLHFKYSPVRNLITRLSYATNIGRPSIGQLIPSTTANDTARTVSSSNPSLKPQTAKNFDLGAEYYFEPAGMVSASLFLKELRNFIYTTGGQVLGPGADNGFNGDYAGYTLTTQANGGSAKVKGIELSYSQQFTFLPGFWAGLGAFANATRMNAEGNYGTGSAIALAPTPKIAGFNPLTGNLGVSYIRNKITARVQATYRGRYLATYNVNESRMVYFRERTRLDIRTLYQYSRRWGFYLDATNLLPIAGGDNRETGGRPSNYGWSSPIFSFGVNARL